jgi:hypothetical protein
MQTVCPFTNACSVGKLLDDSSKYSLYKQVYNDNKEFTTFESIEARYTFWDELSILAYYQNEFDIAQTAYKQLVKLNAFPSSQQDRIYRNAQFYDYGNNVSLEVCRNHIQCLPVEDGVHFIYLKGVDFSLHHYLCILSAVYHLKSKVFLYYDIQPDETNTWWKKTNSLSQVHLVCVYPATYCNGHKLNFKQHQADLLRLLILHHMGGIYLDLDMFVQTDFRHVLPKDKDCTMCRESENGICNAFIYVTKPHTTFITNWLEIYESHYDGHYTRWSITTPHELSETYANSICVLPTQCFYPFDYMYTTFFTSPNDPLHLLNPKETILGIHLWETENAKRGNLPKDLETFREQNTLFYQLAKNLLHTDYERLDRDELKNNIQLLHKKVDELKEILEVFMISNTSSTTNTNTTTNTNPFFDLNNLLKL